MSSSLADTAALLSQTLDPSSEIRSAAEAQLTALSATDPRLGPLLAQTLQEPGLDHALRQAAAVLLRHLVSHTWSQLGPHYRGIGPDHVPMPLEAKQVVRSALLASLLGPQRKLRLASAHTLALVASTDFPDHTPELLPRLVAALQQQYPVSSTAEQGLYPDQVHGALVFLSDFSRSEMDEHQLLQLTNELLPSLESIVASPQPGIGPHLRARAVNLVRQMIETTYVMREHYPEAAQQALNTILPRWIPALLILVKQGSSALKLMLDSPPSNLEPWEQLALTAEALRTLQVASHIKGVFKPHIAAVVGAAAQVTHYAARAVEAYETSPSAPGEPAGFPPEGDSDIASSLPGVASAAMDTVGALLRAYHKTVLNVLQSLPEGEEEGVSTLARWVDALADLAQVTLEQEEEWESDLSAFVAELDEADGGGALFGESLRSSGLENLSDLLETLPTSTLNALQRTVEIQAARADTYRAQGREDWWKPLEAVLMLLGGSGSMISELLSTQQSQFNLEHIFTLAVVPYCVEGTPNLLRAQTFLFASQFAPVLPAHISLQFLAAAAHILGQAQENTQGSNAIAVAAATRTVRNFYRSWATDSDPPREARIEYGAPLLSHLGSLLHQTTAAVLASGGGTSEGEFSVLVLETVQALAAFILGEDSGSEQPLISLEGLGQVAQGVIEAFLAQRDDPVVGSVVEDVLEALVGRVHPPGEAAILVTALPLLSAHVLSPTQAELEKDEGNLAAATVEDPSRWATRAAGTLSCLDALLRSAEPEALQGPNTDAAGHVLPALIGAWTYMAQDREVQQALVRSLTYLIGKAAGPTLSWTGQPHTLPLASAAPAFSTAREFLSPVLAALLDPEDTYETAGLALGPFLCALLRRDPEVQTGDELLRALVIRLGSSKTAALGHGILVPLLFLLAGPEAGAQGGQNILQRLVSLPIPSAGVSDGPSGNSETVSAAQVVVQRWMEETSSVHGAWARKINAMALVRLLSYTGPERDWLLSLSVRGDEVIQAPEASENKIVTRSMTRAGNKASHYRTVPLACAALSALLEEWDSSRTQPQSGVGSAGGTADTSADADGWADEDLDPEVDEDDADDLLASTGLNVSDLLDLGMMDSATSVDPAAGMGKKEWAADPVANLDVKSWVSQQIRSWTTQGTGVEQLLLSGGAGEKHIALLRKLLA